MTFEQWQATRIWWDDLSAAPNTDWAWSAAGYAYDNRCGGCIEKRGESFVVPIANTEPTFATLAEAERHLWDEYAFPEIYQGEA